MFNDFFSDVFGSSFEEESAKEIQQVNIEETASESVADENPGDEVENSFSSFGEDLLGSSFDLGEDFFTAASAIKTKAVAKPSKDSSSKTSSKDGKGKNTSSKDVEVNLPVVVRARNFAVTMDGEGKKKLSDIWDELIKLGYEQLSIEGVFNLVYVEILNSVFVCEKNYIASDMELAVDFSEEQKITVCDGMLKAEFSLENFEGKEADEVSLLDVAFAFSQINPSYEGCKMAYDLDKNLAYPIMGKIEEKLFADENYSLLVKEGNRETLANESYKELISSYGEINSKTAKMDVVLQKGADSTCFLSYVSTSGYEKSDSKKAKAKDSKKVDKKYLLPLEVFVVNWGESITITEADADGKSKVTIEETREVLGNHYKIFKDKSRKIDSYYEEEKGRLSVMLVSGSKGCELIRSEKEFQEAKRRTTFFDGIYSDKGIRLRVLANGNFLTYNGEGRELFVPKRMEWERRLPKMPIALLKDIVSYFREDLEIEAMVRIYYNLEDGSFSFEKARGEKSRARINYEFIADIDLMKGKKIQVMDIHSHNTMQAFFSGTDDRDESGYPGLFGVIGNLHETPKFLFRAGVDGVFKEYPVSEFFEAKC